MTMMNCDSLSGSDLGSFVKDKIRGGGYCELMNRRNIPKSQSTKRIDKDMVKQFCTTKLHSKEPKDELMKFVSTSLCGLTKEILHDSENFWGSLFVKMAMEAGVVTNDSKKASVSSIDDLKACLVPGNDGSDFDITNVIKLGEALYVRIRNVLAESTEKIMEAAIKKYRLKFDDTSRTGKDDHLYDICRRQALQNARKRFNQPGGKSKSFRLFLTTRAVEETEDFLRGKGIDVGKGDFTIRNVGNIKELVLKMPDLEQSIRKMATKHEPKMVQKAHQGKKGPPKFMLHQSLSPTSVSFSHM